MLRVARLFLSTAFLVSIFITGVISEAGAEDTSVVTGNGNSGAKESAKAAINDTPEPLSEEASAYLVDWKLGDAGIDLIWDGYWKVRFTAGGAFGKKTDDNVFSGLSRGTAFEQEPDLTISLWMYDRWFIETTFLEGFDHNTYRAGYMGRGDEFVKEVIVGNAGVNADSFAGAAISNPDYNAPGIVGKFATGNSEHQLLLRYDPTDPETKTFYGQYEVDSQEIGLSDFIEGRFFILPDEGVSDVVVYLEEDNGSVTGEDGMGTTRRYREAEATEFFVDEDEGLLELSESHDGQVVVYYTVGADEVGDSGLGNDFIITPDAQRHPNIAVGTFEPFDFETGTTNPYDTEGRDFTETSRVNIDGTDHLLLYTPGKFSPFERQNVYLSSQSLPDENWRITTMLEDRGSLYPESTTEFDFETDADERTVEAYGSTGSGSSLRDVLNRYPFAEDDPQAYGPGRETDEDKLSRLIVLAVRESNNDYFLGTGVVAGSVSVTINGVLDSSAEVSSDGYLEFSQYIYATDWIEVSYRTESLDLDGGDLFLYQGNRFTLGPNLTWELAESVRWNLSQESSVEEYGESPGEIALSSVMNWQTENAGISFTADASLTTPDTVGNLRLYGMEDGEYSLVLYDDTVVRSPDSVPNVSGSRVALDQYNYIDYSSLGQEVLYSYMWSGTESTGDDGPALASDLDGDPTDGRVMDLRFTLDDDSLGSGEWAAGDALTDTESAIDLSGYTALEIPVLFLDDYGTPGLGTTAPTILLQIGEIGEYEDYHDDGSVNGADAGAYCEWDFTDTDVEWETGDLDDAWIDEEWRTLRIPFTTADRAKLGSVRSWRIVIDNQTDAEISGRMIVGPPQLEGSSFRTVIRDPDDNLVSAQDVTSDEVTDTSLGSAYSDTDDIFHSDGDTNKSLKIQWGDEAPGGDPLGDDSGTDDHWEAVSWFSDSIPMSSYKNVAFYVKPAQSGTGPLTASITDGDGKGITVSWNCHDTIAWDRIEVNIPEGTASADRGTILDVTVDADAGELSRFFLSGVDETGSAISSATSGTLYLDEIHFAEPTYSVSGSAGLEGFWNYQGDVATIGNFPILGDISADGSTEVTGGKVLSGIDKGTTVTTSEIGVGADVLGVKIDTDWRASWGLGEQNWSGSHSLRIPARLNTFWIGDEYSRSVSGDEATFSRRSDVNLRLRPGSATLYGETEYDGTSFVQTWGGKTGWAGRAWKTSLDVEYALETDQEATAESGYMKSWVQDYAYIIPSSEAATGREAQHEFNGSIQWGQASLHWTPELGFEVTDSPDWSQENTWAGTLSFPIQFEEWSITTSYSRNLAQTVDTSEKNNSGFDDAWSTFFNGIHGQWPLFTYAPFLELFGTGVGSSFETLTDGLDEVDYEVEFAVDVKRFSGNHWLDFFVPSGMNISIEREYQREGDTAGWEDEWTASLNFSAYNLFGEFGRYSIFPFYNTEELTSLLQFSLEGINETKLPSPEELTWQIDWNFEGNRKRKLVLSHKATWYWDEEYRETVQEGRIEFHWRAPSKDVLHIPFIKRAIPRRNHMESVERLAITGEYPWQDAPEDVILDFGVTLYHETSWVFQDLGEFTGWLAFGLGGTDGLLTNGWEIGLEAEVHF